MESREEQAARSTGKSLERLLLERSREKRARHSPRRFKGS